MQECRGDFYYVRKVMGQRNVWNLTNHMKNPIKGKTINRAGDEILKKSLLIIGFILLLAACSDEVPYKKSNKDEVREENPFAESSLHNEVVVEELMVGNSYEDMLGIFGMHQGKNTVYGVTTYNYDSIKILVKDEVVVGILDERAGAVTASGIAIGDSADKLQDVSSYLTYKRAGELFYYDDLLIAVFGTDETNEITRFGLYELDTYLDLAGLSLEEFLATAEESSVVKDASEEEAEEEQAVAAEESTNDSVSKKEEKAVVESSEPAEAPEEDTTEEQQDEYYDPFQETTELAAFSKTVNIGDSEQIVRDYMGEGYVDARDQSMTIYQSPPIKFIAQDGVITYISWGRSGSFEDWETKEGIGRRSTIAQAEKAYQNFNYKLLYKKGLEQPSYMVMDYDDGIQVFEFTSGHVSFIFRSVPELLDHYLIQDVIFMDDDVREQPFK